MKHNSQGRNRIAVIASTAMHKSAARRNFWKRQAKAALLNLPNKEADFLLNLFTKTNALTKEEFRRTLLTAAELHGTKKL